MKTKTFLGADSTQAMRKVKQALGDDVTLLSCRRVKDGVEIVVGVDAQPEPSAAYSPSPRQQLRQELDQTQRDLRHFARNTDWASESAKNPSNRKLVEFLKALDIEPRIGAALLRQIPADERLEVQQEMLHSMLRRALRTLPVPREGVTALVGPAGAGKTSSIAKIAADFVRRGRSDDIALITTDTTRIAAEEQLRIYGNIFQIPVHAAANANEASHLIDMLSNKRYLLIDTEGVGIRDNGGLDRLQSLFAALPDMDVFLTLPADRDQHTQWEITQRFRRALPINGIVATNLDQCVRMGALMSVLIQSRLPAVWLSDGTRIPGNLKAADSKWIISEAIRLAREFKRSLPMGEPGIGGYREAVA